MNKKCIHNFIIGITAFGLNSVVSAVTLTDPQIAAVVTAANAADVEAGRLAQQKSANPEVKAFAQNMVIDHSSSNLNTTALVTKLKVTPQDSEVSNTLKSQSATTLKKLNTLQGAAFDKEYVDNEIAFHQTVLNTIDNTLIPNAKNPELKAMIEKVRPAIKGHLEHAKHVQTLIMAKK